MKHPTTNRLNRISSIQSKFTLEDIRDMEIILELYKRGVCIASYNVEGNKWAVRVACSLIPLSTNLATIQSVLSEWYYDRHSLECYFEKETSCNLCQHPHCLVLFPIRNLTNQLILRVGSNCVTYFCSTVNLFNEVYDINLVLDNLSDAEKIAREEHRLEVIRGDISENMPSGKFRDDMLAIHTVGSKSKNKVTPNQASILEQYLSKDANLKIILRTEKQYNDANQNFNTIVRHLTEAQKAKFTK